MQVSGEQLRIRAERRGLICVLVLTGPLTVAASTVLTQRIEAEQAIRPARLIVDMSGVNVVDLSGARALSAAARPGPGYCPVVVRSLRPAVRRRLELTGLDMAWLGGTPASAEPRGWDGALADSPTGTLVREWHYVHDSAAQAIAASRQAAQALALTEDHVAATLAWIAARRPAVSDRLERLSRTAQAAAVTLRDPEREADPAAASGTPRAYTPTGTVARAVAFIDQWAGEDIGVADIAAAAFVTVRAVQLAFRRNLGMTPLGYLRQVRLERAHAQLLAADPARTTVTAVATDWWFTNPSRFTAYYRDVFGVPPAQTLRERLQTR